MDNKTVLEIGKIPLDILNSAIFRPNVETVKREEVVVGPAVGEDCSAIKFDSQICLLSSDPITGAADDVGYLAVHVNVNDIAASGGEAIGIMVTVLLPENSTVSDLEKIMSDVYKGAKEANIEVIGGHTEVTNAVTRPLVSATIIGKAKSAGFISTSGAKAGHDVVMTKYAATEGVSIIAAKHGNIIKESLGEDVLSWAKAQGNQISVVKEASVALEFEVSAMHDITEGGVFGACYELAAGANKGITIQLEKIPIHENTTGICKVFNINPYKLISSGSLLICTPFGEGLAARLRGQGINAAVIGKITDGRSIYIQEGEEHVLSSPESDEIYKI